MDEKINEEQLKEAKEKLSCSISLPDSSEPVRLTQMTTAGG